MSTLQDETSEQLQQMFGALRSLLAEDTRADGWGDLLLELSEDAYGLDEQVWQEQWASYIRDASRGLPAPLLTLKSLESFEHAATLLPGCLFSLYLGSNEIGDEGARALAQSEHLASLTHLHLWGNEIGDEGAIALAQSPHLASLTHLNLWSNEIGEEGKRALSESVHLSGVEIQL